MPTRILLAVAAGALLLAQPFRAFAHDIPDEVIIQAFLRTSGPRLQLLIRVPLIELLALDLPQRGPGYLALERIDVPLRQAAQRAVDKIELYEGDSRLTQPQLLGARISLPSDRSFASYEEAVAHVIGPALPIETNVFWNQGFYDALVEYPIRSAGTNLAIRPHFPAMGNRLMTVLRFLPEGRGVRAYELIGDPGIIRLDPRWHHAAWLFVKDGFFHILDGTDHLLFLFCLVIPFRRFRSLILVVTSFTAAHSVTLIASAYGLAPGGAWFPPLIETLIAASIVYMALENIVAASLRRRWLITFAFGLVHGFGFSFALRQRLQFAGSHLLTSLLSFNVGVEIGQIGVLVAILVVLGVLFRFVVADRIGTVILSALVAHTGWHWMIERAGPLSQVEWPVLTVLVVLRWLTVFLLAAFLIWLASVALVKRAAIESSVQMEGEET